MPQIKNVSSGVVYTVSATPVWSPKNGPKGLWVCGDQNFMDLTGKNYVVVATQDPSAPTVTLTLAQQAEALLATGLTLVSASIPFPAATTTTPGVTFPTDTSSIIKYDSIQTRLTTSGVFPGGSTTFKIKDTLGNWYTVTAQEYTKIVSAISDFVAACYLVIDGYVGATLPQTTVVLDTPVVQTPTTPTPTTPAPVTTTTQTTTPTVTPTPVQEPTPVTPVSTPASTTPTSTTPVSTPAS